MPPHSPLRNDIVDPHCRQLITTTRLRARKRTGVCEGRRRPWTVHTTTRGPASGAWTTNPVRVAYSFTEEESHGSSRDLARHVRRVVRRRSAPRFGADRGAGPGAGQNAGRGQCQSQSPTATIVNINTASATELATLPGIGAKTAARIIEYRQKNGPFKKVEELMNVRGIGEKNFLKLKPQLAVASAKADHEQQPR